MLQTEAITPAKSKSDSAQILFFARHFVCTFFCALLFFLGVLSLILPKPTVSEYERRELAPMPEFSVHELFWGNYLRDVEEHYADTFPFREGFVQLAAVVEEARGIRLDGVRLIEAAPPPPITQQPDEGIPSNPTVPDEAVIAEPELEQQPGEPFQYEMADDGAVGEQTTDGLFIYKNKAMSIFGGSENMGTRYAQALNAHAVAYGPGVNVYNVVVPTSIEFGLPERYKSVTNPQRPAIDHIYNQLSGVTGVNAYDAIARHADEYVYFNTDHHWTVLGAYYAYTAYCEAAGLIPLSLEDYDIRSLDEQFLGTLYSQTNDSRLRDGADQVDYYVLPGEFEVYRYMPGAPYTPTPHSIWAEYATGANCYSVFLHGDFPLMEIRTGNKNGRRAVVIKESFGNAFAPFLAAHYEELYIVDERYFERGLVSLVQEKGIDDVVFINNAFAANTGYHIEKIEGLLY